MNLGGLACDTTQRFYKRVNEKPNYAPSNKSKYTYNKTGYCQAVVRAFFPSAHTDYAENNSHNRGNAIINT